jgi:hypothetical protein
LALGGRRFINMNNNQMEDGVDVRGCIGEEARPGWNVWGGWLPIVWGGILIDKKNREMGGPFALDGHCLMAVEREYPNAYVTAHLEVPGKMFHISLRMSLLDEGVVGSTSKILDFIKRKIGEAAVAVAAAVSSSRDGDVDHAEHARHTRVSPMWRGGGGPRL